MTANDSVITLEYTPTLVDFAGRLSHLSGFVYLDSARANVNIGHLYRVKNFLKLHVICAHRIWVDVDLVFFYESADRCNFAYSID